MEFSLGGIFVGGIFVGGIFLEPTEDAPAAQSTYLTQRQPYFPNPYTVAGLIQSPSRNYLRILSQDLILG